MLNISTMTTRQKLKNQSGMASIIVVMILMTVLALISVGFSHLMNREVKQSFDRQLSLEATYAAESGLNDARIYLANNPGVGNWSGCKPPSDAKNSFISTGDISGDGIAKYSCINLVTNPAFIEFNLSVGESQVFRINQPSLGRMYFSWQSPTQGTPQPLGNLGDLPREDTLNSTNPNATGVLRTAIYPVPAGSKNGDTLSTLNTASRNYFLYPNAGSGATINCPGSSNCYDYGTTSSGMFLSGSCNAGSFPSLPYQFAPKRFCNTAISGLQGSASVFYIKITALYAPIIGEIEATNPSGNSPFLLKNSQGTIDVTGSGSDAIKRVRAVINTTPQTQLPSNALWSMQSVCKLFRVEVDAQNHYSSSQPPRTDYGADPSGDSDGQCAGSTPSNSGGNIDGSGAAPLPGPGTCQDPAASNFGGSLPCQYSGPPPPPPPSGSPPSGCNFNLSAGGDFSASGSSPSCSGGTGPISFSWSWSYVWTTAGNQCTDNGGGSGFSLSNPAGTVNATINLTASNAYGSQSVPKSSGPIGVGGGNPC